MTRQDVELIAEKAPIRGYPSKDHMRLLRFRVFVEKQVVLAFVGLSWLLYRVYRAVSGLIEGVVALIRGTEALALFGLLLGLVLSILVALNLGGL